VRINLRPTTPILHYSKYGTETSQTARGLSEASQQNLKKARFTGEFTEGARKRCSRVGQFIIEHHKRKLGNYNRNRCSRAPTLAFITLTYPCNPQLSDKECKRQHLNNFLIQLSRRYSNCVYLWRAENQKSGRLHFHILVNRFVCKTWLSEQWYNICQRSGYYPAGFTSKQIKKLPATNVEGVRSIRGAQNYLVKYLAKYEENKPVQGRLWSSNVSYDSAAGLCVNVGINGWYRIHDLYTSKQLNLHHLDYCTLVDLPTAVFIDSFFPELAPYFDDWLGV